MKPILHTRQALANGAAAKWFEQRSCNGNWSLYRKEQERAIYDGLVALGPNPDPDAVDKVIGNGSWTSVPTCSACENYDYKGPVVQVGQEPDYESSTAYLCPSCLSEAAAVLATSEDKP